MSKMKKCKTCGTDIAANAKVCPSCGAKNKKPIYKKWWFWAIIAVILIAALASGGDKDANTTSDTASTQTEEAKNAEKKAEPEIEYTAYNVTELFDALSDNALKAEKTFKGQYVEISGYLGTIDSSGDYIGVGAGEDNYDYLFQEVLCNVKSDNQLDQIMEMSSNDPIVVRGQIVDVGELLGYKLNIDSIG